MREGRTGRRCTTWRLRAGVSTTTASYILNGRSAEMRIAPATEERVRNAATELAYRPNPSARNLRTSTTRTVGLIGDMVAGGPFAGQMIIGATTAARPLDHTVLIGESDGDPDLEAATDLGDAGQAGGRDHVRPGRDLRDRGPARAAPATGRAAQLPGSDGRAAGRGSRRVRGRTVRGRGAPGERHPRRHLRGRRATGARVGGRRAPAQRDPRSAGCRRCSPRVSSSCAPGRSETRSRPSRRSWRPAAPREASSA